MGNKILGKRSRNYFKGLNDRQLNYIKEKFQTISTKGLLDKDLFMNEYKLSKVLVERFFEFVDFDESNGIDEYEFICAVHTFCNMTVSELGERFFMMVTEKQSKTSLTLKELKNFTEVCIKYNFSLENKAIDDKEITKINKDKFAKYDYDKNKSISKEEFIAICTKDEDFKKWFYNMGFITKNQLQFNDQVYDFVDSDVQKEIKRHLKKSDPKVDKIKRGIEHKIPDEDQFEVLEDEGQQALPVAKVQGTQKPSEQKLKAPWQVYIEKAKCEIHQSLKENPNSPSQSLTMKHIFGYRSYDCRNNIRFDSKGNIIYHQGSVGIVMNERRQQFYMREHKDDIVCLDTNGDLIVTGELGSAPSVVIWTSAVLGQIKSDFTITEGLKESVGNVSLSKTSRYLAVNCDDSDHTLLVYDISTISTKQSKNKQGSLSEAKIKASGVLSKSAILDLNFTPDEKFVVAASLKQILFVKFQNTNLNADRGQFGEFSSSCGLCLLPLRAEYKNQKKNWMLSGMANGSVYFWEQNKCVKAVSGHNGSVSALASIKWNGKESFVSGDKTGKIIVWGEKFQIVNRCSIVKSNSFSNMIVSISVMDSRNGKDKEIIVGTKSSTVYRDVLQKQLVLSEKNAIVFGHNQGNLWALAVDQSKNNKIFYTGGDDQRLIKWSFGEQNKFLQQTKCKYKIRALSHNKTKKMIAVGYMNGVIELYNEDLTTKNIKFDKIKNADKQILNLVKFSEDGSKLLASYTFIKADQGKKDSKSTWSYGLIIFSLSQKQLKKQKQIDLDSKVIAADFEQKGRFIRLNTEAREYHVYDIRQNSSVLISQRQYDKEIPKLEWQTHSVFMSPETQKFKTEGVTESDIICCERSRKRRNVILIGDKYSKIKLFNYPCINYPIFNKYEGHSSEVTAIQFDSEEDYVISIGGQEKSIIVWQYDPDIVNNKQFFNQRKQEQVQVESQFIKEKGEQCPAISQFKGMIKPPSDFKSKYNSKRDNKLPKEDLSIQHVFGIRNQYLKDQVRNQCRFSKNLDHILFPTACLGVKMKIKSKTQTFYHEHKEDVVSFAVDKNRNYMATGQMAQKNTKNPRKKIVSICVWDIQANKLLKKLQGFHTVAVVLLEFSPSGKLLCSVGNDEKNSFAVYDWKAGRILYSGPVSGGKVNGIAWKSQTEFMTCGNDHVKFWQNGKGRQGKFSHGKLEPIFSCVYLKDDIYLTGSATGMIHAWKGNTTLSVTKAYSKIKIQSIFQIKDIVYTGADDGVIKSWKVDKSCELKQLKQVFNSRQVSQFSSITDVKNIQEEEYGILSIDIAENMDAVIVTKGASVIHLNLNQGIKSAKIIHQGHYKEELWGLATYQNDKMSRYVITGGDDKTVRLWDLERKQQVKRIYLQRKCRAVDCQQSGEFNILAADSRAKLYLMDKNCSSIKDYYTGQAFQNYDSKKSGKNTQPWVQELKFSPGSDKICYGTHGESRFLQIVQIQNNKFSKSKPISFKGGSSAVTHIDWSRSGNQFTLNTQAWQYLFFSSSGKPIGSATSLQDEQWATYTRKYGFQSQGIFQDPDHSNINTVCRDPQNSMLAVGYDDQTIRVFNYPCYTPHQVFKILYGHSSHVTRVRFTNEKMVSLGGLDRTMIVWNIKGKQINKKQKKEQDDDGLDDVDQDVDLPAYLFKKKPKPVEVEDFTEIQNEGDEFMAVKPWIGAIKEPTYKYPKSKGAKPKAAINLEYVFGYRTKDCRQNLFYKNQSTIIYHAAAVLVEHDIKNNKQKLFTQHNDDILSIDYNKQKDMVLTGQIGPKPLVCLYQDGEFKYSFKSPVTKGVISVSISPNGKFGVCVGMDQNHQIAVIDLVQSVVLAKQKGGRKVITKIKWISDSEFVTIGINFYAEWKYDFKKITRIIQTVPKSNNVSVDVCSKRDLILVGANNSSLFNFSKQKNAKKSIFPQTQQKGNQKQAGVIEAVKITDNFIACGTRNGKIVFLDRESFKLIVSIDLNQELDEASGKQFISSHKSENCCIRAIDFYDNKMLIGTLGSQIYEAEIDSKFKVNRKSWRNIIKGHYSPNPSWLNEVWGLAIPQSIPDLIVTCSDDSTIRVWSLSPQPRLIYCLNIKPKDDESDYKTKKYPGNLRLRSVAVSPNSKFVAVGAFDGTLRIFKFDPESQMMIEQEPVCTIKHAKEWISDIKFGFKSLIVGSHDNGIYVYDFEQANDNDDDGKGEDDQEIRLKLKHKRPLKKHSSYITHMDVSRDSCFLQSTCGAYQILFWDLNSGKQIPGGATMLKDQKWKTWTCNIGWPVQGIYPKEQDGTFINAVDRSNTTINQSKDYSDDKDFYLLAAGNDHGKVAVYSYPTLVKNSKYIQGKGHSSHVTTVRWTNDDKYIASVGGEDQCLMIWKVQKNVISNDKQDQVKRKPTKKRN